MDAGYKVNYRRKHKKKKNIDVDFDVRGKKRRGRPPKIKEEYDYSTTDEQLRIKVEGYDGKEIRTEEKKLFVPARNLQNPVQETKPVNSTDVDSENSRSTAELMDSILKQEQEHMQVKQKKHKHKERKHNESCKKHSKKKRT